jgi:hypothetical protein
VMNAGERYACHRIPITLLSPETPSAARVSA